MDSVLEFEHMFGGARGFKLLKYYLDISKGRTEATFA